MLRLPAFECQSVVAKGVTLRLVLSGRGRRRSVHQNVSRWSQKGDFRHLNVSRWSQQGRSCALCFQTVAAEDPSNTSMSVCGRKRDDFRHLNVSQWSQTGPFHLNVSRWLQKWRSCALCSHTVAADNPCNIRMSVDGRKRVGFWHLDVSLWSQKGRLPASECQLVVAKGARLRFVSQTVAANKKPMTSECQSVVAKEATSGI